MKEIWKKFSAECKAAWLKTKEAFATVFNDFIVDLKDIINETIDLVKNIIANIIKAIETVCMGLIVAVLTSLFEAIYDSVMYLFDELLKLLGMKN
jgi:phage-related protein